MIPTHPQALSRMWIVNPLKEEITCCFIVPSWKICPKYSLTLYSAFLVQWLCYIDLDFDKIKQDLWLFIYIKSFGWLDPSVISRFIRHSLYNFSALLYLPWRQYNPTRIFIQVKVSRWSDPSVISRFARRSSYNGSALLRIYLDDHTIQQEASLWSKYLDRHLINNGSTLSYLHCSIHCSNRESLIPLWVSNIFSSLTSLSHDSLFLSSYLMKSYKVSVF